MSIELPIELSASQAHEAAIHDVNRWRGHCVECFARLERSLGEVLTSVPTASSRSKGNLLTFGDKLKELSKAISPAGPLANPRLFKALDGAGEFLSQRNRVVHASGKVWIDGAGKWAWAYRFLPAGKPEEIGVYEQKAAENFEMQLAKTSQSLCDQLQTFRKKLTVAE